MALRREGTVLSPAGHNRSQWKCRCDCGKTFSASLGNLASGSTTACVQCGRTTHGGSGTLLYYRWRNILNTDNFAASWRRYRVFKSNVGRITEKRPFLCRRDKRKPWGPHNFYWSKFRATRMGSTN